METSANLKEACSFTVEMFSVFVKTFISLFIASIFGAAALVALLGGLTMLLLSFAVFAVSTFIITVGDFGRKLANALKST